jgi:hypothetical protein
LLKLFFQVWKGSKLPELKTFVQTGTQKLKHLRAEVEQGQIKVPQFQRDFVWDEQKAADLIDSMLKGYPIGALIYWRTDERLRQVRNLGRIKFDEADIGEKVNYVLDGQQRLTSILSAIYGLSVRLKDGRVRNFEDIWVSLDDVEDDSPIVFVGKPLKAGEHSMMPLPQLWSRQGEYYENCPTEFKSRRNDLNEQIRDYEIPKVTLINAELSVATEVFSRINTGGQELSVFEIMVAKTYDPEQDFDLVEKFDEFHEELTDSGFESIDATDLLQLVTLIIEDDCKKRTILDLNKSDFIAAWPKATEAVRSAVGYIKTAFKVPVSRLLPYSSMVVPIALFFYLNKHKPPKKSQAKHLSNFFWRCGWSERYSSSADSRLAQDKNVIKCIFEQKPYRLEWSAPITVDYLYGDVFSASKAFSKTVMALLASARPLKYNSGDLVYLQNDWLRRADSVNFHHVFPKSYLRKRGYEDWEANRTINISLVDDFLNKRVIRARPPSDYMADFEAENDAFVETMATHLISAVYDDDDEGSCAAIWSDDYEEFLGERASAIIELLSRKVLDETADA